MSDFIAVANEAKSGLSALASRASDTGASVKQTIAGIEAARTRLDQEYRSLLPECAALRDVAKKEAEGLTSRFREVMGRVKAFEGVLEGLEKAARQSATQTEAELLKLKTDYQSIEESVKLQHSKVKSSLALDAETRGRLLSAPSAVLDGITQGASSMVKAAKHGQDELAKVHKKIVQFLEKGVREIVQMIASILPLLTNLAKDIQKLVLKVVSKVEGFLSDAGKKIKDAKTRMVDRPIANVKKLASDVPHIIDTLKNIDKNLRSAMTKMKAANKDCGGVFDVIRGIIRKIAQIITHIQNIQRKRLA